MEKGPGEYDSLPGITTVPWQSGNGVSCKLALPLGTAASPHQGTLGTWYSERGNSLAEAATPPPCPQSLWFSIYIALLLCSLHTGQLLLRFCVYIAGAN
jgi:hypothetical protein